MLALGETTLCLPPKVGLLGRDKTASPIRGWPRAIRNYVSYPELASGEMELHLLSDVGLGRDRIASLKVAKRGVNRQAKIFSTKTRNKLGKTGSAGVKTSSTGLNELNFKMRYETELILKFTQLTLEMRCSR
jgi:hypothetical protein